MYKALVTFSGLVSAYKGQTINIENQEIAKDSLEAGYIESVDNKPKKETTKKVKEETPEQEVQLMKVSQITYQNIAEYIRLTEISAEDISLLNNLIKIAKA